MNDVGWARRGRDKSNTLDRAEVKLVGVENRTLVTDATGFYGAVDLEPGKYMLIANGQCR